MESSLRWTDSSRDLVVGRTGDRVTIRDPGQKLFRSTITRMRPLHHSSSFSATGGAHIL